MQGGKEKVVFCVSRSHKTRVRALNNGTLLCSRMPGWGGGGTPYSGLYGEAPPDRGTFFRLQVYKTVGISQVEVYKRVGISAI